MRSEFRDVARPLRDRLLTADIPFSMHIHARGVERNVVTLYQAGKIDQANLS